MLINKIIEFTAKYNLVECQNERILVGVSGGVDSMVMLNALHNIYTNVAVAHCNFSLRPIEADNETKLVESYCAKLGVKLHHIKFDTKAVGSKNKKSTQIVCRELRYDFFETLCQEYGYAKIAIAHNLDDCIETQMINSLRGAALKGFASIRPQNGKVIRPLMSCSRDEIENYAQLNNVPYLNDSSNREDKYLRNKLRHHVVPKLREMGEGYYKNAQQNFENLREDLKAQQLMLEKELKDFTLQKAMTNPMGEYFLYKFIETMGFNRAQAKQILKSASMEYSGTQFLSKTKRIIVNRNELIVTDLECSETNVGMVVEVEHYIDGKCYKASGNQAYLDADKISGELCVRKWQQGDRMTPYGMMGSKKISDILIDAKVAIHKKNEQNVVVDSSGGVVWLVGLRTSAKYAVTSKTKHVAVIILSQQL